MQTRSRLLHDLTRVAGGAMSTAVGAKDELEALVRHRLDRLLQSLDLAGREELEAIRAVAVRAREEQERLGERVAELERQVEALSGGSKTAASTTAGKKAPEATRRSASKAPGGKRQPSRKAGSGA
jgi:BMFP domain-containing protein YqiC